MIAIDDKEELIQTADKSEILLLPTLLQFLDWSTLIQLFFINKATNKRINQVNDCNEYWSACCRSFAHYNGLFIRPNDDGLTRKYFFDELFVAKNKWHMLQHDGSTCNNLNNIQAFKIKVSCRFRPGNKGGQNMCLPLHQFLKVRRQARADTQQENALLVGEEDPLEFLDPFLGTLMREPVLLLSSSKICDRAIAIQCILRGGKDPFNGEKLTRDMIVPQVDLLEQINAWRVKKDSIDVGVSVGEAKSLIDEGVIDAELLEVLMEVRTRLYI